MERKIIQELLVIVAILSFNWLFWSEKMGLNVLLYTIIVVLALWYRYPESRQERQVWYLTAGTLIGAVWVVTANSLMSKWFWSLSLCAMAGSWQFNFLRFLWYSMAAIFMSVFSAPALAWKNWAVFRSSHPLSTTPPRRRIGWGIGPVFLIAVFIVLYSIANPYFGQLMEDILDTVAGWFSFDINFERIFFFIFGFMLTGALLWRKAGNFVAKLDGKYQFDLMRQRRKRPNGKTVWGLFNTLALRHSFDRAVFTLIALNVVTFLANILDIKHVWWSVAERNAVEMKTYVHEGTYILILSILLAMGLLFHYFYQNLNFFQQNERLKTLAYCWIGQNAFLALSVGVRNIHYINAEALGYKRIGVFIFLTCVLFGLFTMLQKIQERKTIFYVLCRNAWFTYTLILVLSAVQWDVIITNFNLDFQLRKPEHSLDRTFLIYEVSDKNLWVMDQRRAEWIDGQYAAQQHESRINNFKARQRHYSWLSWNYPDWLNRNFIVQ
jgi:Domain of unknown function (DUF4173)